MHHDMFLVRFLLKKFFKTFSALPNDLMVLLIDEEMLS